MQLSIELVCLLFAICSVKADSTKSFKNVIGPIARECMTKMDNVTEDDFQAVFNRNPLETRPAMCLLKCVYQKLGVYKDDGALKEGDDLVPIIERIYGFNDSKNAMRIQAINTCVQKANADRGEKCEEVAQFVRCVLQNY
uniref:Chemosensory protein n=1 Tax=Blattella germanica TaxID=6973 RepID=A0A0X8DBH8_BLAGE|nr:chemosensory protein [Blattella germanica]